MVLGLRYCDPDRHFLKDQQCPYHKGTSFCMSCLCRPDGARGFMDPVTAEVADEDMIEANIRFRKFGAAVVKNSEDEAQRMVQELLKEGGSYAEDSKDDVHRL